MTVVAEVLPVGGTTNTHNSDLMLAYANTKRLIYRGNSYSISYINVQNVLIKLCFFFFYCCNLFVLIVISYCGSTDTAKKKNTWQEMTES